MPPRKQVKPLHRLVTSFIVRRVKKFQRNHGKVCCFCKGIGKYSSLQNLLWENYFADLGVNVTFDCPDIVKTVDFLLSFIPPYEMKNEISSYFSGMEDSQKSIGCAVLELLANHSNRGSFCSKIKSLVKQFGLLSFHPDFEQALEELKHFLPVAPNLLTLDLKFVEPTEEILETIGKGCMLLRRILSLQILKCSWKGLKKMLFSDSQYTARRNICNSLRYVFTVSGIWRQLEDDNKVKICIRWYLILKNCPNISMMQEDFNCAEVLRILADCKSYVHDKILKISFSNVPSKQDIQVVNENYSNATHIQVFNGGDLDLPNFTNVTCFRFGGYYEDIQLFLKKQGTFLQELLIYNDSKEPLNLNEISVLCPNITYLGLSTRKFVFKRKGVSLKSLKALILQCEGDPDILWLAMFVASLPRLKGLLLNKDTGKYLTEDWINTVISYGGFQKLRQLTVGNCELLNIDGVSKWIYSCPKLLEFTFKLDRFERITLNEWIVLQFNIIKQNYDFNIHVL